MSATLITKEIIVGQVFYATGYTMIVNPLADMSLETSVDGENWGVIDDTNMLANTVHNFEGIHKNQLFRITAGTARIKGIAIQPPY